MLTDPIASFITMLRNATRARRGSMIVPSSRVLRSIAQVLKTKRFIEDFEERADPKVASFKELYIKLRTDRGSLELKRISKPGQRIYFGAEDVKRVRNGLGLGIFSTSSGIISDDEARKLKVGGEYLCEVY